VSWNISRIYDTRNYVLCDPHVNVAPTGMREPRLYT
jgi:hypothetical protein